MLRRACVLAALTALGAAAAVYGCGSSDGESTFDDGTGDSGSGSSGNGSSSGFLPGSDGSSTDGSTCATGKTCGDAGVCAGNVCCDAKLACGDVCCGGGQVCSYQKCVTPGAVCRDSSECGANEYCEYTLGTATDGGVNEAGAGDGGADAAACVVGVDRTGRCLPRPPVCAADAGSTNDGGAISCVEKCEFKPTTASFTPVLKYSWGNNLVAPFDTDIMHAPIVIELDDDDCDGKITERDIPEIVFSTFKSGQYEINGVLHAISLVNGTFVEKWKVPNAVTTTVVNPTKHIAAGNFDGKPGNEVVACGTDGKVHAFRGTDGTELWATASTVVCFMPSIADLDGDGAVEVVVEGAILNGADGTIKKTFTPTLNGPFVISDLDSDGKLDIVTSSRGYHSDGTMFVDTGVATTASFPDDSDWKGPWAAIGDFDLDGKPEVVAVDNEAHKVLVWRYDAAQTNKFTIVRQPVDMNALFATNPCSGWGATHGGGPPTIADFDKDGVPDVGLAGGIGYVVFDGKKLVDAAITNGTNTIMWAKSTIDCSSASTGSTVFDFNGDGKAEVVYSDEKNLRIYEGATGNVLADVCNTTATLTEFPIVADVDNDGHADIIVVSNAYAQTCTPADGGGPTKQAGIRVFGDTNNSWVRTRRVWNEHAYHITNVNEDGTIPQNELANWKQAGLNNFRQNKQPGSEFAAPNLVASLAPLCPAKNGVTVTVRNVGEALVPAGVVVGVYAGSPPNGTKLGTVTTTRVLYPAESEPLDLPFPNGQMPLSVYAVVDDGAPAHPSWTECRTDDNVSAAIAIACGGPN